MQPDERDEVHAELLRNHAVRDARQAAAHGLTVLIYKCEIVAQPPQNGPLTIEGWIIEAIEGEGWRLEQLAYNRPGTRPGALLMLFRRTGQAT
jgi:hypothetical protein